jgi:hypothetical protein
LMPMAPQMSSFASPSFASPGGSKEWPQLATNSSLHEGKPRQSGDLSVGPSIREVPKTPAFFIRTSKLRSFASPGEPKDGPTLAPILPPSDGELQRYGTEESSEDMVDQKIRLRSNENFFDSRQMASEK